EPSGCAATRLKATSTLISELALIARASTRLNGRHVMTLSSTLSRRELLSSLSAGAASLLGAATPLNAQGAAGTVNFTAWSAAVDQVKSHISAFENATKLKVNYENFPWAQYRTSVVTRLVGNAPMDVMWVSDAWLPEFAE